MVHTGLFAAIVGLGLPGLGPHSSGKRFSNSAITSSTGTGPAEDISVNRNLNNAAQLIVVTVAQSN